MSLSAICRLLPAVCAAIAFSATAAVTLDVPGHVCTEGEAPTARGGEAGSSWTLFDWRGVHTGLGGVFGECGETALPPLPSGYYRLVGESGIPTSESRNQDCLATIAVVPAPKDRTHPASPFHGVDSAQSWVSAHGRFDCPWNGGDTFRTVSDLIWLAGFSHVRDRMRWGEVEKEPGAFDYGKYLYNAELLRERGIGVLGMFHDCPPWAGRIQRLPARLDAVYDSCKRMAADFGDRMEAWEFWNEPDISFAPEPVWDYAAALKAAYLGMKAARPDMPVMHGGFAQPPGEAYSEALYDNDAGKFSDAYAWHNYGPVANYSAHLATARDFLSRHGFVGRAVIVTESGTNMEGPAPPEALQKTSQPDSTGGGRKVGKAHSPEQELVVAEFYPKSQIALQMEGVSRNYFFLFGAYGERGGAKDWGVLRRDGTAKPVFSAMSSMLREVGSARLDGELLVGDGLRAFLFEQPDGSQTLAFWAVSPVDTSLGGTVSAKPDCNRMLRLELPSGKGGCPAEVGRFRLADMCGGVSSVEVVHGALSLAATRFPAYVSGLSAMKADIQARPRAPVVPYQPGPDEDLTVVLRAELDSGDFELAGNKTCAMFKGATGRVRVQVWNLGDCAKTGRVDVTGCPAEGLPDAITLGPRGTPPFEFDCTLAPSENADAIGALDFMGIFNGLRSSSLHVSFVIPDRLANGGSRKKLDWRNPANWRRNDSADSYAVRWDEAEQAIRFDVGWSDPDVDRWFYPMYGLKLPEEGLEDAVALGFEVKSSQDKLENDFRHSIVWLVGERGGQTRLHYQPPIETWERRLVPLHGQQAPEEVTAIRVGANPQGARMTFWIRNVEILHGQTGTVHLQ